MQYSKDDIVVKLLDHYGLFYDNILKPKTKTFAGIVAGDLFKAVLSGSSAKAAALLLNCSDRTVQRCILNIHGSTFTTHGGGSLRFHLLTQVEIAHCNICNGFYSKEHFYKDNSRTLGITANCILCKNDIFKLYYENNKGSIISNVAERRAHIIKATPRWANLSKIKELYKNCPKGYHVDHIIPLRGINICGLHVENNLQYLLAKDNLVKGNKWEVS